MTPRILVYTCVFGGYDRVFPPVHREPSIDYVLVTDDVTQSVPGWRILVVDTSRFWSATASNRYFKMLAHRHELAGYDVSVYVDGNIRVIGSMSKLVAHFLHSGAALGVFRHPVRESIAEEVEACLSLGKVASREMTLDELEYYRREGFSDKQGLIEASVLLKSHTHRALDEAMDLWWQLFERYDSRDQFSLPFVMWKHDLPIFWLDFILRRSNPYFHLYPHLGTPALSSHYLYWYCTVRSLDNPAYALLSWPWRIAKGVVARLRKRYRR